jgi:SAM-dependent methyltransferase
MNIYIQFIILLVIFSLAWTGLSLAPWVPTWKKDLTRILRLANLQPSEKFYDLGCGDGKVVFYASQNSEAKVIGFEAAWPFFIYAKIKQLIFPRPNLSILLKNLYKVDLRDADCIYVFGTPKTINQKLEPKLSKELKPGSRVISYAFPFTKWTPELIDKPKPDDIDIYLYQIS